MKIIDSHIHFDQYDESKQSQILADMEKDQVEALLAVSMDLESSMKNNELSRKDSRIKPAFGFHPEQRLPSEREMNGLLNWMLAHQHNMIAVGEIGLPFYLRQEDSAIDLAEYIKILERFLAFAKKIEKPVILHAVHDDAPIVCDLLEKHDIKKAHFHWFKGDSQTIASMIQNRYRISITPDVCYEREIKELVAVYPLELMMVETDGPWQFEGVFKGKSTHPGMIRESIRQIAIIKDLPIDHVYETLYQNTKDFYDI
ncbi:TatD family hydrolase [Peribacillus muralis]|uniref:TatD family hydrolase n=1 Tax=Peribacillus muralis TaxID=264697 RepID=UPI0036707FF1